MNATCNLSALLLRPASNLLAQRSVCRPELATVSGHVSIPLARESFPFLLIFHEFRDRISAASKLSRCALPRVSLETSVLGPAPLADRWPPGAAFPFPQRSRRPAVPSHLSGTSKKQKIYCLIRAGVLAFESDIGGGKDHATGSIIDAFHQETVSKRNIQANLYDKSKGLLVICSS